MSNLTKKIVTVNIGYTGPAPSGGLWFFEFYRTDAEYGQIIASHYGSSGTNVLWRSLYGGVWKSWERAASTDYAVSKSGDTMTGDLGFNDDYGHIIANSSLAQYEARSAPGDRNNRRGIRIYNPATTPSDAEAVRVITVKGGNEVSYAIFHTGNLYDTFTCALESGITGSIHGTVCGKVCYLEGYMLFDTPVTSRTKILTIPSGYRPKRTSAMATQIVISAQDGPSSAVHLICSGYINNSGELYLGDSIVGTDSSSGIKRIELGLTYMMK
jgi:hypothetical protein